MRALLLVLDSVGCGRAPDAAAYGDEGADTLGHIFDATPGFELPTLFSLGLGHILGRDTSTEPRALWGRMRETSAGKDTTTGHWELAGCVLGEPFATFEEFPRELIEPIEREAGVRFIGNCPRSGTVILEELGAEHVRTGQPILYTSADSVLQIAAHEAVIPPERLYEICRIARAHADPWRIGRVIARPFEGETGSFRRTAHRHDFSMIPPRTVLNALSEAGVPARGIGKISDIFAGSGITESHPTASNAEGMAKITELWSQNRPGLIFCNLVDFDMLYGHRRDVAGYAAALKGFDGWLETFSRSIQHDDIVIITADHGNDPTFRGSDHTREEVPLIVFHQGRTGPAGTRKSFADAGFSVLKAFGIEEDWPVGESFL